MERIGSKITTTRLVIAYAFSGRAERYYTAFVSEAKYQHSLSGCGQAVRVILNDGSSGKVWYHCKCR